MIGTINICIALVVLSLLWKVRRGTFFFWSMKMSNSKGRSGGSGGDNARK
jgi:hypothetical protein